jgi:hypothetical protein
MVATALRPDGNFDSVAVNRRRARGALASGDPFFAWGQRVFDQFFFMNWSILAGVTSRKGM